MCIRDRLTVPIYANLLSSQYSMLEPGNAMKWDVTQPTQTTYNFQPGDELVAFAQANDMFVRGHNLCWYQQFPQWLAPYAATATPAQMATLLQNHITTEVTHFAGQVFAWDVVNEAFNDPSGSAVPGLRDSIWYNQPGIGQTGTGYISQAFQWARAADPNALLFYNDYNIEEPVSYTHLDVYKRQVHEPRMFRPLILGTQRLTLVPGRAPCSCLLYTSRCV